MYTHRDTYIHRLYLIYIKFIFFSHPAGGTHSTSSRGWSTVGGCEQAQLYKRHHLQKGKTTMVTKVFTTLLQDLRHQVQYLGQNPIKLTGQAPPPLIPSTAAKSQVLLQPFQTSSFGGGWKGSGIFST